MGIMNRVGDESKELEFATNESKSEGWKIVVVTNDFSLDLVPSFPATLNGAQHARFVSGPRIRFLRLQGRRQKRDECEEKKGGMIIFFLPPLPFSPSSFFLSSLFRAVCTTFFFKLRVIPLVFVWWPVNYNDAKVRRTVVGINW